MKKLINGENEGSDFLKLFYKKQKAYEDLKDYVLNKTLILPDKKFRELNKKEKTASKNFNNFLSKR